MQPLIERDFYGKTSGKSITAPNLKRAYYTGSAKDAIALEFDQPVVWNDSIWPASSIWTGPRTKSPRARSPGTWSR